MIDVAGEKITISSDKDLELLAAKGKFTVNANEVEITAKAAMTLKGATIDIN